MCFLFVILLVLWKFNTMCFDQYPSIPPTSATHSLSTQIGVLFCFHPSSPICGTSISSDVWSSTGMWSNLPGALLLNWISSSQHPSAVNISLSKSETAHPPLLSMLGVGLAWACTSLMHTAETTVSSYVPLPFWVRTTPSNALFVFLSTFPGRCRHTAPIYVFMACRTIFTKVLIMKLIHGRVKGFQIASQSYGHWLWWLVNCEWIYLMTTSVISTNQKNYGFGTTWSSYFLQKYFIMFSPRAILSITPFIPVKLIFHLPWSDWLWRVYVWTLGLLYLMEEHKWGRFLLVLGIRGKHSTTELHVQPL